MPNDSTEIELKLAVVSGEVRHARRFLGDGRLERTRIEDVYFDTPDSTLRSRGLVLRLRRDGDRWLQTLKATTGGRHLVPVRGEWEVALPAADDPPALDLERFDIAPLRILMRGGLDTAALAPVFRTRISRRRGVLVHNRSRIEVALDSGELRGHAAGRKLTAEVAELELELKSGSPQDLLDVGTRIVKRGGGVALVPALRSKAERGYALVSGEGLKAERASARSFADVVQPQMSTAEAMRATVRHGIAIVVANADAIRANPSSEHIHQARVAMRRMRSALRLFDPFYEDFPSALGTELRWLTRTLGDARDWDVLADVTLPSILSAENTEREAHTRLRRSVRQQRRRAIKAARASVSSRRYARLIMRLASWSTAGAEADTPAVEDAAPALLEQAADALFKAARTFARLGRDRQHRVRIHAKRLRYALDILSSSLPPRGAEEYTDALAQLQDSLGELNDAAVAREKLLKVSPSESDERLVNEWHDRVRRQLVQHAAAQIAALARRGRPWSLA